MNNKLRGISLMIFVMILAVILGCWEVKIASAQPSDAQCKEERRLGTNACMSVVIGSQPSPECCHRVRVTRVECFCSAVTSKLVALVPVNRAISLIEGCGRRVPRNYKCGSYTTPP